MTSTLTILIALGTIYLVGTTLAAYRRVRSGGAAQTEEFLRAGVSFSTLRDGTLEEQESGSTITTREGVRVVREGKGVRIVPTRTISRDLF